MQRSILAILSLAFCAGAQAVSEDVQLNLVTTWASVRPSAASKSPKPTADSSSPPLCGRYRRVSTGFIFMPKAAASRR